MEDRKIEEEIDLLELAHSLWKRKKVIILTILFFGILSLLIAFLIPNKYTSTSSIMLIGSKRIPLIVNPELTGLDVIFKVGLQEETRIKAILESQLLRERVVRELNLTDEILKGNSKNHKYPTKIASERFKKNMKVSISKDGVIQLNVVWSNPDTAQLINQKTIEVLKSILDEKNLTETKISRKYYESEVQKIEQELQEINKRIIEIQKENKNTLNSPEYIHLLAKSQQVKAQYETLIKLLEQAKIEELKEGLIEVISPPSYPEKPSSPNRILVVSAGVVSGLFTGIFFALIIEALDRRRGSKSYRKLSQ